MDLTLGQQRVEDLPGVVDGHEADQLDAAGLGVDRHHRQMGAEGERRPPLLVGQFGRQPVRPGGGGHLGPGPGHGRGAGHVEGAVAEDDVGRRRLEQLGGQVLGLRHDLLRGQPHGRAAELQRSGAEGADAGGHRIGVAVDDVDRLHGQVQVFAGQHG